MAAGRGYRDGFIGNLPCAEFVAMPEQCRELREAAGLSLQAMADLAHPSTRSRWHEHEAGACAVDAARWPLVRARVELLGGNEAAALAVPGEPLP